MLQLSILLPFKRFFCLQIFGHPRDLKQYVRFETKALQNLTCRPSPKFVTLSYGKDNSCASELKAMEVELTLL